MIAWKLRRLLMLSNQRANKIFTHIYNSLAFSHTEALQQL